MSTVCRLSAPPFEVNARGQVHLPPSIPAGDFYVIGGTLRPDAPSYVERQADKDLCEGLSRGEFCYVLTSRQMGKSSLMVRTVQRLRQDGVAVAVLDLTAIGQNLSIEQWYDGLMSRLGQQLDLEDELLDFWHAHPEWGPLHRWISAIEQVVLPNIKSRVVIFVDEIDIVRSLPFSTDEFFAAIRETHNRRSQEPGFARLAFGLLGVAAPTDLIRDTRMTPFNIGRRIVLNDFTEQEAAPLANGISGDSATAQKLLSRVLYWTGGHPYLTQRLCRALAETLHPNLPEAASSSAVPPILPTIEIVDRLANELFLSRQARDRDDNLIFVRERLLRSEVDVAGLLYLYRRVHNGQPVADDETNPLCTILRLSGIVRGVDGYLEVRNRIYSYVFDQRWCQANMPQQELRRQRSAGRRGILLGLGIAVAVLLLYLIFGPMFTRYRERQVALGTLDGLRATYQNLKAYQDTFETSLEMGLGGTTVQVGGSGSLEFQRPNRAKLILKSRLNTPPLEVRWVTDGHMGCVHLPSLEQFHVYRGGPGHAFFELPQSVADQVGPLRVLPVYRLFLTDPGLGGLLSVAQDVQYGGVSEIDGSPVKLIKWEHPVGPLLFSLGLTNSPFSSERVPVSVWIGGGANPVVVRIRLDLSRWSEPLLGSSPDIPVTSLVLTETHKTIDTAPAPFVPGHFRFEPPFQAQPVSQFELPKPNFWDLASPKRKFSHLIASRLPQATPNLIDLSDYYNAALTQAWHGGAGNNTLEVLPSGLLQLGDTVFDVRGIVQLSGRQLYEAGGRYPRKIAGIKVGQSCRQLHFLQAAGWRCPDGTRIGSYVVHCANGQERSIPIVYGEDVRDWSARSDPSNKIKRGSVAWSGLNHVPTPIRLFKTTWVNPWPETEILSIDFVSTMAPAAPFLIALTAEE